MTTEKWNLKGGYFENCNCQILCPCVVPGPPLEPTEGHCDVGFAFHVDQGDYNGVSLDGLNFVIAAHTPGIMGHGGWTTAFYVDERANDDQRRGLGRILSGEIGGPMAAWMSLTANMLGITYAAIDYQEEGMDRRASIPGVMDFHVRGIRAGRRRTVASPVDQHRPPGERHPGVGQGYRQHLHRSRHGVGQHRAKRPLRQI